MKNRIGESSGKKKRPVTVGAPGDSRQIVSERRPPQKPDKKLAIIIGVVVLIALIVVGVMIVKNSKGGSTPPDVEDYPINTREEPQEVRDERDLLFKTKAILVPTIKQLADLSAISELIGEVKTAGDGVNANVTAALDGGESLATKAAAFKESTNSDTTGWLKIPNTNIDYPVVYKAGKENYAYYNSLDYEKNYSKDGVIWADYECEFPDLSQNTTLYGHNWHNIYTPRTQANAQKNDVMFALLTSYHYTEFAQQNPFIYFSSTEKDYVWQVFASFYTDVSFTYSFAEMDQRTFQKTIAEAKAKSLQQYNVPVTSQDKILTLSTCTRVYGNTNNQRFVVMAKLVPEGTPSTSVSTYSNHISLNDSFAKKK